MHHKVISDKLFNYYLYKKLSSNSSKFFLALFLSLILKLSLFSQTQAVFKEDIYMVLNTDVPSDAVFVVLDNGNSNALKTSGTVPGTGGNIITKHENNQVKWNIGTNTGNYTVPFTTATNADNDNGNTKASESKIPLSLNITGAGTGSGNIKFSSYTDNDNSDNFRVSDYKPSDVTNMYNSSGVDNSANVVDRFWIIDANGYSTKPAVTLSFTYDDQEAASDPNNNSSLVESEIFPQRFNSDDETWSDVFLSGTVNETDNTLSGVNVSSANFFKSWALVSSTNPLPVELMHFNPECEDNTITVEWTTATENNNDYFVIEKSLDGATWTAIDSINGAGNSVIERNYSYQIENHIHEISYFRLKQVDYDNTTSYSDIELCACSGVEITDVYPNPSEGEVNYVLQSSQAGTLTLTISDAQGRLVKSEEFEVAEGRNLLKNVIDAQMGKYFITVEMADGKLYDYDVIVIK